MRAEEVSERFAAVRRHAQALTLCNRLKQRAALYDLWRTLRRKDKNLVCFGEVVGAMRAHQKIQRGIRAVPIRQIMGSVGRSQDFTRDFLPRSCINQERWARLALAFTETFPVVELYQVGEIYFVVDGHHRISVAYARGCQAIEADVTEVMVPLVEVIPESIRTQSWSMSQRDPVGKPFRSLSMPY